MQRPKAYSYVRMSTPDQLHGDSLRRQLARTKKYADENGLEIVERIDDLGVSADPCPLRSTLPRTSYSKPALQTRPLLKAGVNPGDVG